MSNNKRRAVLNEIYDTERKYVDSLFTVIDIYLAPLRANQQAVVTTPSSAGSGRKERRNSFRSISPTPGSPPSLDQAIIQRIFSNIELVAQANQNLCDSLAEAREKAGDKLHNALFGKAFLNFAPYVKMYELYCSSYETACDTVRQLQTNDPVAKNFFDQQRQHPRCQNMDLLSLLIMPIQRVPRYGPEIYLVGRGDCVGDTHGCGYSPLRMVFYLTCGRHPGTDFCYKS